MTQLLHIFLVIDLLLLILGLYQPWRVIWWMSHQNRLKVIQIYGTLALVITSLLLLI